MAQTEDIPYEVDEFALEDTTLESDPEDQTAETTLIRKIRSYLKTEIQKSTTFDVINLPANATPEQKIAAFDEMAIHKGVAMHLRNVQQIINDMVKE